MKKTIVKECPKCKVVTKMTRHHIFPQRHFGKDNTMGTVLFCQSCHANLEKLIPFEVMPLAFYKAVVKVFLQMED